MKKVRALVVGLLLQVLPAMAFAGGEGLDLPEAVDRKVALDGLSGVNLFFAQAYNGNLWLYAIYCTLIMAVVGVVIAYLTDLILKAVGMEVHKIEHKE